MTTTKRESVAETSPKAGWMQSAVEKGARTWIGQAILRQLDTFLWVVEKSAEWSLPRNEDESEESRDLVRPLPWMLFLPTLLFLRMIRASLNMGALMLGFPRVSSTSMVRFAQKSRYRLATVGKTSRSSKKMRDAQDKRLSMNQAKKALIRSIRLTLSTLSCLDGSKPSLSPPPTRIHISALDAATGEKSTTGSSVTPKEKMREELTKFASQSDVFTEPGRNDQLECNSHDETKTEQSYDGQNEDGQSDEGKQKKHKVECDQQDDDGEVIEQTVNDSPEKTPGLSQDSDIHFFSPVESSASRSRSSSDSSISNSTQSVRNSHQRNSLKTNEYGNGEARFITEQTDRKIDVTKNRRPLSTGRSLEETNNGKRGTSAGKYHHYRGKRTSHGNRKKK
ncbi:PREDICTED: uncharacterized protein LOC106752161 isoform X2 [Dinoponera quadriceps]|uniref:Uncharacterized protein LOC106752161 isoform X2 n=1 Tax=Dinoponera quadriceps TaxID=609295 RepID=A0A6P3YFD0_DINQU|nr:PREDICTED: uncharacterized protein LOC106752161 isoform X2 [Dinoponera quadriceps]